MIQWPNRLGGRRKIVGWLNRLLDRVKAGEIKQVIGGRLIEASDGKTLIVEPGKGGGGPEVEVILCVEGEPVTYLLKGRIKPDEE